MSMQASMTNLQWLAVGRDHRVRPEHPPTSPPWALVGSYAAPGHIQGSRVNKKDLLGDPGLDYDESKLVGCTNCQYPQVPSEKSMAYGMALVWKSMEPTYGRRARAVWRSTEDGQGVR